MRDASDAWVLFVRRVADELGFRVDLEREPGNGDYLCGTNGERLHIFPAWPRDKGRAEVTALLPSIRHYAHSRHGAITVAMSRPPAAVARDIQRRLLNGYAAALETAQRRCDEDARERSRVDQIARLLVPLLPEGGERHFNHVSEGEAQLGWWKSRDPEGTGRIRVHRDGSLTVEISSIRPDLLGKMLAALK